MSFKMSLPFLPHLQLFLIVSVCLLGLLTTTADAINCYTDVDQTVAMDCQMHTGCMKKFDKNTQQTLQRSCYLTPGVNDTCTTDDGDDGIEICFCHTDLCNKAAPPGPGGARGVAGLLLLTLLAPTALAALLLN